MCIEYVTAVLVSVLASRVFNTFDTRVTVCPNSYLYIDSMVCKHPQSNDFNMASRSCIIGCTTVDALYFFPRRCLSYNQYAKAAAPHAPIKLPVAINGVTHGSVVVCSDWNVPVRTDFIPSCHWVWSLLVDADVALFPGLHSVWVPTIHGRGRASSPITI